MNQTLDQIELVADLRYGSGNLLIYCYQEMVKSTVHPSIIDNFIEIVYDIYIMERYLLLFPDIFYPQKLKKEILYKSG